MRCQLPFPVMLYSGIRVINQFVLVTLLWGSAACSSVVAQDIPVSESHQILWKVQSPQNTVYLAGSIHVLQPHHYPLHHVFEDAFQRSSRVIFEVDLDGVSSPSAQRTMLQKGLYRNGQSLPTVLSPKHYAEAKSNFAELGLQIEDFHRMKPWMTATAVMALELKKLGFESAYGVDRHFFDKAQAAKKDIQGLETVDFQLDLFDQLPLAVQEQFLLQTLEELKDLEGEIQKMVTAWQKGNVQELEALLDSMRDYPELFQELVVNRNNVWLAHIEQALQEQEPVFIVVGALHLLGKEGLVAALKEKRYLVIQL